MNWNVTKLMLFPLIQHEAKMILIGRIAHALNSSFTPAKDVVKFPA